MNIVKEAFNSLLQMSLKNNISLRLLVNILHSVVEKFNEAENINLTAKEKDIVEKIANEFASRLQMKDASNKILN